MSSAIAIVGIMGGTGYGVYRYFNPAELVCEDSQQEGDDEDKVEDLGNIFVKDSDLSTDFIKQKTANDAYNRLYSCLNKAEKANIGTQMEDILHRYDEKVNGTASKWMFFKGVSPGLEAFRDRICRFKLLTAAYDIPEETKNRWLGELKEEGVYGKRLTEDEYKIACDFISE